MVPWGRGPVIGVPEPGTLISRGAYENKEVQDAGTLAWYVAAVKHKERPGGPQDAGQLFM